MHPRNAYLFLSIVCFQNIYTYFLYNEMEWEEVFFLFFCLVLALLRWSRVFNVCIPGNKIAGYQILKENVVRIFIQIIEHLLERSKFAELRNSTRADVSGVFLFHSIRELLTSKFPICNEPGFYSLMHTHYNCVQNRCASIHQLAYFNCVVDRICPIDRCFSQMKLRNIISISDWFIIICSNRSVNIQKVIQYICQSFTTNVSFNLFNIISQAQSTMWAIFTYAAISMYSNRELKTCRVYMSVLGWGCVLELWPFDFLFFNFRTFDRIWFRDINRIRQVAVNWSIPHVEVSIIVRGNFNLFVAKRKRSMNEIMDFE